MHRPNRVAYKGQNSWTQLIRKDQQFQSACALRILKNRHEYRPFQDKMTLIKSCGKGTRLDSWKVFYIENDQQEGLLIEEQDIPDLNQLLTIAQVRQQHDTGTQADRYTHNCTHTHAQSRSAPLSLSLSLSHTNTHTHTHTQDIIYRVSTNTHIYTYCITIYLYNWSKMFIVMGRDPIPILRNKCL
jgi:hypothetical protein